jgi:nitrile hydratase subunit beta
MNGGQDLGGQMGFGPIAPEPNEPVFHAPWEKRVLAMSVAAGAMGHWSIDESRFARENIPPAEYQAADYYTIWIGGLETLLLNHTFVSSDELAQGKVLTTGTQPKRVLKGVDVNATLLRGFAVDRPATQVPLYAIGQRVRMINDHPKGHTRLPRYARGKIGVIENMQPSPHVLPDTSAHGAGENPQWLYTVAFTGEELWGHSAEPGTKVSVEAWESYIREALI